MIDFHNHILPNIDDGAKDIEQTLELIKEAKKVGFDKIIFTPHYVEDYYEVNVQEKTELFNKVSEKTNELDLDIELYLANEVYMPIENLEEILKQNKISTINNTRYMLFELPMNSEPFNLFDIIYDIQRLKLKPILAHPERYLYIQKNPELVYDLIERGVLMQQNFGSIVGQYGKNAQIIAKNMLKTNSVHFLGSDVHRPNSIYKIMPQALNKIEKIIGKEKLEELTITNPSLVLENQKIDIDMPEKIKFGFLDKMKM